MIKYAVFLLLIIASAFATQNNIFSWSNSYSTGISQNLDTIYTSEIPSLLQAANGLKNNQYSTYFGDNAPQFSILFLTNTRLTQYHSIKHAVSSSKSSLAMPYGYFSDSIESLIASTLQEMDNVYVYGDFIVSDSSNIELQQAKDLISSGNAKGSIVIDLRDNDNSSINDIVSSFNKLIKNENAVAIVMDISSNNRENISLPRSNKGYKSMKQILASGSGYETRFPGYIIEALLVTFLLVLIAVVGIVCTCKIQTPEGFETPHKHKD